MGDMPAVTVKNGFRHWFMQWRKNMWSEDGLKAQEERFKKEVHAHP